MYRTIIIILLASTIILLLIQKLKFQAKLSDKKEFIIDYSLFTVHIINKENSYNSKIKKKGIPARKNRFALFRSILYLIKKSTVSFNALNFNTKSQSYASHSLKSAGLFTVLIPIFVLFNTFPSEFKVNNEQNKNYYLDFSIESRLYRFVICLFILVFEILKRESKSWLKTK